MIPIRDDNPVRGIPVVTILTMLACMAVYLWQLSLPPVSKQTAINLLGFMPALLFGHAYLEGDAWVSPTGSMFTAMFLHGGFFHLAGNMLYLWIFGDNVEDRVGRGRFIAFYLICGAIAALTQALPDTRSTVPMIGASGAVSGVLGAYVVQLVSSMLAEPGAGGVAFVAHIGGFIGGAVLIRWFLRERRQRAV
jgi:membrane associated rhomboid family serine protease